MSKEGKVEVHHCGTFTTRKHVSLEDYQKKEARLRQTEEELQKERAKCAGQTAALEFAQESLKLCKKTM